ncbi:hypothetical protein AAEX28_02050 [Lentisphaerota bacterium WC36G]|nr:hypothetical protein LJT99_04935 [Lentisphaerae bacterium WC36]
MAGIDTINSKISNYFQNNYIKLSDIENGMNIPYLDLVINSETVKKLQDILQFLELYEREEFIENSLVILLFTFRNHLEVIDNLVKKISDYKNIIEKHAKEIIKMLSDSKQLVEWSKYEQEMKPYKRGIEKILDACDYPCQVKYEPIDSAINKTVKKYPSLKVRLKQLGDRSISFPFEKKLFLPYIKVRDIEVELKEYIQEIRNESAKFGPSLKYSREVDNFRQFKKNNSKEIYKLDAFLEIQKKCDEGTSMRKAVKEYLTNNELEMTQSALLMAYSRFINSEKYHTLKIMKEISTSKNDKYMAQFIIFKHFCNNYFTKKKLGYYILKDYDFSTIVIKREYNIFSGHEESKNTKNKKKFLEQDWKKNKNLRSIETLALLDIEDNDIEKPNKYIKASILAGLERFSSYTANYKFIGLENIQFDILRKRVQILNSDSNKTQEVKKIEFNFTSKNGIQEESSIKNKLKEEIIGYISIELQKNNLVVSVKVNHTCFYEQLLSIFKFSLLPNYEFISISIYDNFNENPLITNFKKSDFIKI